MENEESCCTVVVPPLTRNELNMISQFLPRVQILGQEAMTFVQLLARIEAVARSLKE